MMDLTRLLQATSSLQVMKLLMSVLRLDNLQRSSPSPEPGLAWCLRMTDRTTHHQLTDPTSNEAQQRVELGHYFNHNDPDAWQKWFD